MKIVKEISYLKCEKCGFSTFDSKSGKKLITKNGKDKHRNQKYFCNNCNNFFTEYKLLSVGEEIKRTKVSLEEINKDNKDFDIIVKYLYTYGFSIQIIADLANLKHHQIKYILRDATYCQNKSIRYSRQVEQNESIIRKTIYISDVDTRKYNKQRNIIKLKDTEAVIENRR